MSLSGTVQLEEGVSTEGRGVSGERVVDCRVEKYRKGEE